jgi:MFS family permease
VLLCCIKEIKLAQTTEAIPFQARLNLFLGVSWQIITTIFIARLMIDTGNRMMYPFIPQIAAGLGLTIGAFGQLVFIRSLAGMTSPIFGGLADKYGRRKIMALGLFCEAIGVAGIALSSGWWAVFPMMLCGLSLAAFLSPQQAYISDQVSYEKRGRALAAVEFSWAIAGILSLPLVGWMIDRLGWPSPFLAAEPAELAHGPVDLVQVAACGTSFPYPSVSGGNGASCPPAECAGGNRRRGAPFCQCG